MSKETKTGAAAAASPAAQKAEKSAHITSTGNPAPPAFSGIVVNEVKANHEHPSAVGVVHRL
jgi:hypothetical protein